MAAALGKEESAAFVATTDANGDGLLARLPQGGPRGVRGRRQLLTVKIRQPSHEFTFGVGISFIPYPLVLTPVV
jgi:hypothetical protein